jgi:hypothetical protein
MGLNIPWRAATPPAGVRHAVPLIYTCAGGHDVFTPVDDKSTFLPVAVRKRLLRRALSYKPDALIANGESGRSPSLTASKVTKYDLQLTCNALISLGIQTRSFTAKSLK